MAIHCNLHWIINNYLYYAEVELCHQYFLIFFCIQFVKISIVIVSGDSVLKLDLMRFSYLLSPEMGAVSNLSKIHVTQNSSYVQDLFLQNMVAIKNYIMHIILSNSYTSFFLAYYCCLYQVHLTLSRIILLDLFIFCPFYISLSCTHYII